jgi:hypothetical protein
MARFMVVHQTPAGATQEQLIAGARKLSASLTPGTQWLNSWWFAGEVGQLFCEWEAESEDAIRASLEPVKELFPILSMHLVTKIEPAWYT